MLIDHSVQTVLRRLECTPESRPPMTRLKRDSPCPMRPGDPPARWTYSFAPVQSPGPPRFRLKRLRKPLSVIPMRVLQ
jgi:hypothetical protein